MEGRCVTFPQGAEAPVALGCALRCNNDNRPLPGWSPDVVTDALEQHWIQRIRLRALMVPHAPWRQECELYLAAVDTLPGKPHVAATSCEENGPRRLGSSKASLWGGDTGTYWGLSAPGPTAHPPPGLWRSSRVEERRGQCLWLRKRNPSH